MVDTRGNAPLSLDCKSKLLPSATAQSRNPLGLRGSLPLLRGAATQWTRGELNPNIRACEAQCQPVGEPMVRLSIQFPGPTGAGFLSTLWTGRDSNPLPPACHADVHPSTPPAQTATRMGAAPISTDRQSACDAGRITSHADLPSAGRSGTGFYALSGPAYSSWSRSPVHHT